MQNNTGRHRKPSATRVVVRRTAVSVGAAAAAIVVSGGGAMAAEAPPATLPLSCTGSPLDAFTTCATGGHATTGSDRGDATGGDTPNLGGGGGE